MLNSMPKSLRDSEPVAVKPAWVDWSTGNTDVPKNSTSSSTGFVIPFSVRSPISVYSSPDPSIEVERNVIFGFFSALKKSLEARWASRSVLPVDTLAMSISAVTLVDARSCRPPGSR